MRIEDYGFIGNCETGALINREGSIDWLCLPHFDSRACFAKLLGGEDNGFWRICPVADFKTTREYRDDTMILETTYVTATGKVKLIDAMIIGEERPTLTRTIEGIEGEVEMRFDYVVRFDYGSVVPWITRNEKGEKVAVGGPDSLALKTTFPTHGENLRTVGRFRLKPGERHECVIRWYPSHLEPEINIDIKTSLEETAKWWRSWIQNCTYEGEFQKLVRRSLLTLKSLTFAPTGGIVAAPTTSLPEKVGGSRNWDYRYSWLRDSTFTLYSLLTTGFHKEAEEWRRWLVRAVAGTPSQVNIMYGIRGERRLTEIELDWLSGFANSSPVRIGNGAYKQRQLDIFGELMDTLHLARRSGLLSLDTAWSIQKEMVEFVIESWQEPDEGIWEMRGEKKHFVHSKVMAWVALDRAVRAVEDFGQEGENLRWKRIRDQIKSEILERGFNQKLGSFVQAYDSEEVDASLLILPVLGFISANDPMMVGTVRKIETDLMRNGLLLRYRTEQVQDGLAAGEGNFLACSFWLVDYYVLAGRIDFATRAFQTLISRKNDLGLFSEEIADDGAMLGNFPQALSHIAMINSAVNLSSQKGSAKHRSDQSNLLKVGK